MLSDYYVIHSVSLLNHKDKNNVYADTDYRSKCSFQGKLQPTMPTVLKVWSFHKSISNEAKENLLRHFGASSVQHVGRRGKDEAVLGRHVKFRAYILVSNSAMLNFINSNNKDNYSNSKMHCNFSALKVMLTVSMLWASYTSKSFLGQG